MRRSLTLFTVLMLCGIMAFAQSRVVSGKISDEQGNPVPNATITEAGTKNAVKADENGNFTITATNARLIVTATGHQPQTVTAAGNTAMVTLVKGNEQLQEVVVTALGIRRTKNQLPYAAQQISGEEVSRTRTTNVASSLSGKISGLEIRQSNTLGGSTNVVIRGTKSLTSNNQALFVIDGVPFDNSNLNTLNQLSGRGGYDYGNAAADINPDDIESITVLKGAASTALYGSRGSNGVIMITTKKGRRGLGITINSGVTVGKFDKNTFTTYQHQYGGGYGQYYEDPSGYFLYRDPNNGYGSAYTTDADGKIVAWDPEGKLVDPLSEDASYGAAFDPNLMVYQWSAFDPTSPNFGKPTPWLAAANDPTKYFETALSLNNSIFIDGASDKGTFKLGYTRGNDKGILPNSKITKDLFNFSSSYNLTPKLTANASVNYTKTKGVGRYGTGYDAKNPMQNFRQWWQTNVDVRN